MVGLADIWIAELSVSCCVHYILKIASVRPFEHTHGKSVLTFPEYVCDVEFARKTAILRNDVSLFRPSILKER